MFKHFMDVAKTYANQFEETKEEAKTGEGGDEGFKGFCQERQKWGEKRAIIVRKPEQVLTGEPGQVIFAEIEVQNQTKWPWKRGCFIGLNRSELFE